MSDVTLIQCKTVAVKQLQHKGPGLEILAQIGHIEHNKFQMIFSSFTDGFSEALDGCGLTFNRDDEVFLHLNTGGFHLTDPASTVSLRDPVHPEHGRTLVIHCVCVYGLVRYEHKDRKGLYEMLLKQGWVNQAMEGFCDVLSISKYKRLLPRLKTA